LLLHQYGGFSIGQFFRHWWPLIFIFWGAIKLFERTTASRAGNAAASPITAGEIFLVLGLLALLGIVVGVDCAREGCVGGIPPISGDKFDFDLEVAPKPVPADSRITIRNGRGDISVHSSDEPQIRVSGKKNARAWSETEAQKLADRASVEIVQNSDGFEIRPAGSVDSRLSLDLEVSVPKKSVLTIRNEKGDVAVSDMATPVNIASGTGDIEVRNTGGDVSIDTRKGDVKVSDTNGNVKIATAHGGDVSVSTATGGLTLDGEFFGSISADKVAKGVRFISHRTDLTLTQLTGHLETRSGNLEITDAPGNLNLRTNRYDVSIENAGGKVKIDNRDGNVELRFPAPPKEDIEVSNAASGITLTLPGSSSFEILADCHSCDIDSEFSADSLKKISTESGDSHLEGKYGSARGPKITLKTSYGSISLHRTSSDMPAPPKPPSVKVPTPPSLPKAEKH